MIAPGDLVRFRGRARRSWLVLAVDGQTLTMTTGADVRTVKASRVETVEQAQPSRRVQSTPVKRTFRTVTVPRGALPADIAVVHVPGDTECVVQVNPDATRDEIADAAHSLAAGLQDWLDGGQM